MNAEKFTKARKAAGFTQYALAELIGVAQVTVSSWECGHKTPRPERISHIISIFSEEGVRLTAEDFLPAR